MAVVTDHAERIQADHDRQQEETLDRCTACGAVGEWVGSCPSCGQRQPLSRTKNSFVVELEPGSYLVSLPAGRTGETSALEDATTFGTQTAAIMAMRVTATVREPAVLPVTETIRLRAWAPGEQRLQ